MSINLIKNDGIDGVALLLTQYERFGSVGNDEYLELFIDEYLDIDEDLIGAYNDYRSEQGYEVYCDDLNEMLYGLEPMEIVQKTYFGDFNYSDDYFYFNGYGNINSILTSQIIREMKEDRAFLEWYIEEYDLIDYDDDEVQAAIEEANKLIAQGY